MSWPIFHLQYKHSGMFANRKYEEQSYPQKSGNVRPHSSNSIENANPLESILYWKCDPIQGHIPLASYKEVPPTRAENSK